MLGTNLYLTHLFPLSVNPLTIQAAYAGTSMTDTDMKKVTMLPRSNCGFPKIAAIFCQKIRQNIPP
jgi:hypothetical protein